MAIVAGRATRLRRRPAVCAARAPSAAAPASSGMRIVCDSPPPSSAGGAGVTAVGWAVAAGVACGVGVGVGSSGNSSQSRSGWALSDCPDADVPRARNVTPITARQHTMV